jgi:hypothetical protein
MCDESDPVDRWSAEAGGKKDNWKNKICDQATGTRARAEMEEFLFSVSRDKRQNKEDRVTFLINW